MAEVSTLFKRSANCKDMVYLPQNSLISDDYSDLI